MGMSLLPKPSNIPGKKAQEKRQCLLLEGPGVPGSYGDQLCCELFVSSSLTPPSLPHVLHAPGWI